MIIIIIENLASALQIDIRSLASAHQVFIKIKLLFLINMLLILFVFANEKQLGLQEDYLCLKNALDVRR